MLKLRTVKKLLIVLLAVAVIAVAGGSTVTVLNADIEQLLGNKAALVSELDAIFGENKTNLSSDKLVTVYSQLDAQMGEFTDTDIVTVLRDPNVTDATKITMLQMSDKINGGAGIESSKNLEGLLIKGVVSEEVRVNLINNISVDSASIKATLAQIAQTDEGAAVMRSLVKLEQNDALMALDVSNKILKTPSKYNADNLRAAVSVKSDYFKELTMVNSQKDVAKEKTEYIEACASIYKTAEDETLKDAIIFGLMNMRDFEAVKQVLNDESVDEALKVACISRNPKTFIDVINGNPTAEDVEFIISAMEKLPLQEVAPVMREKLLNTEHDSTRLRNVIALMEGSRVKSDTSRFEGTPTSNWIE